MPAGAITEFSAGLNAESQPQGITPGPDGNLWFTDRGTTKAIGRITPGGAITEFSSGLNAGGEPYAVTPGPDGNLWFTDRGTTKAIGRITPSGAITELSAGLNAESFPDYIALGPDGNLWFTDEGTTKAIGRITPGGTIIELSTGLPAGSRPYDITAGPDGNLWFTDLGTTKAIGRITPTGTIAEFTAGLSPGARPEEIAPGPDGNVWFVEGGPTQGIGRITPSGEITEFSGGLSPEDDFNDITLGPDGNFWLTDETGTETGITARITLNDMVTKFAAGLNPSSDPAEVAPGSDGNIWFTDRGTTKAIGRSGTGAPEALASLAVSGAQAGTPQQCAASWSPWAGQQPSASLYGFDGYRWLLDGSQVAAGPSYTPSAASIGHQLACAETVTYPLLNVTTSGTSAPVTVVAAPLVAAPRLATPVAPVVENVRESATRWRTGDKLAQISTRRRERKVPVGTTLSFSLNEQASVSFSFTQKVSGRKVARKCVAQTPKNAKRKRCTRTVTAGTLSFTAHAGTNTVRFQGRISPSKRLAPGRYTLIITATNSVGARSAPASLGFTIVR